MLKSVLNTALHTALHTALNTQPNLEAPDDFYEALIEVHRELSPAQSHQLNAALILLLSNHIGQQTVLTQAMKAARDSTLSHSSHGATP